MSEQPTEPAPQALTPQDSGSDSGRDLSLRWLMGGSIVAVIVAAGLILSIVIAVRGDDEPLVPAGDQGNGASTAVEQNQFEPDPFFDEKGRVVYVPLNENGVLLRQSSPATNRAATTAPSGIMLQQVHGNMILPFSTSDGPTRFTDSGVAAGFSRTAQGAGLAAVHYLGYLASGNDRIERVRSAGLVDDTFGIVPKQIELNSSGRRGATPDSFPYHVFEMIKVNFHDDLTRVHIGMTLNYKDGRSENTDVWTDLVWREGIGWVIKFGEDAATDGAGTVPDFSDGWTSWW